MDQKKTLWIIAAVGLFLLSVMGAALIMYAPLKNQTKAIASIASAQTQQQSGWNSPSNTLSLPSQPVAVPDNSVKASEMIVLSDNTKVYSLPSDSSKDSTTIDLNTLKQEMAVNNELSAPVTTNSVQPQNINITVNIPETPKEAVTNEYYVTNSNKVEVKTAEVKTQKVVPANEFNKKVQQPETPKPTQKTVQKPAPKTTPAPEAKKVTQYWVQVAAYSNKKGAENARGILDSNKIPADIFTFQDNKNNLFYRVRVGPYTTKSEAEYWRTRIIQINEFSKAESYVTSTTN